MLNYIKKEGRNSLLNILIRFEKIKTWDDLNYGNVLELSQWMMNEKNNPRGGYYSPSTFKKIYQQLTALLNSAKKNGIMPADVDISGIKIIGSSGSTKVFLSEDEIKLFIKAEPMSRSMNIAKHLFLLSYYTGARVSDVIKFSQSNISARRLKYMTQKTGVVCSVPINDFIRENAGKYDSAGVDLNYNIKELCRIADIDSIVTVRERLGGKSTESEGLKYALVSFHTARRSFATNLALKGVPLNTIKILMGHSDISMTQRYVVAEGEDLGIDFML